MRTEIEGRVAVVTGAANGIGEAVCHCLAAEGARVVLLDRDVEKLRTVTAALGAKSGAVSRALDLTDRAEVKRVFASVRSEVGPVEILVNNVGQAPRERAQEFSEADPALWDFILNVSLMTTLFCSQQVIPSMREHRWGKIVNISSEVPFTGGFRSPEYTAAKAGVVGFTRALARQLAAYSINVNSVGPGPIKTAAMESFTQAQMDKIKSQVAMNRLGAPAEIADAVCFLASERANYITGQTLLVNGGGVFH